MTTAPISATFVAGMCDAAERQVRFRIENSPVKEPPEPGDESNFFLPDPEKFAQYKIFELHYKDLNFILRLREMCELARKINPLACVNLSLKNYSRLTTLTDKQRVYSPDNPID